MRTYSRLSITEREEISRGLAAGKGFRELARRLGRDAGTVCREVGSAGMCAATYRAEKGQYRADSQKGASRRTRRLEADGRLRDYVYAGLRKSWSPKEVAERLKKEYPADMSMRASHETIYTHLYCLPRGELKRELLSCLRQDGKLRADRKSGKDRRGQIPDMLSIEERPAEVADRTVPGHWEGDLVLGAAGKSAVGTLVERTTRFLLLVRLEARDAASVRAAFAAAVSGLPAHLKRSLTYDRGKEMAEHLGFTSDTGVQVYFAHPHAPWERGTNENTNGLLRQYLPKGTDLSPHSAEDLRRIQDEMNGRPRAALGFFTPFEAMKALLTNQPVALEA
jgi:IS30 family transposase